MSSFAKSIILFTIAISASAYASPHASRNVNHHRALAARVAIPEPEPAPVAFAEAHSVVRVVKRASTKRCKARTSSTSLTATPSTSVVASTSVATSSSATVSSTILIVNPESSPAVSSTPTSTSTHHTTSSSTEQPQPTTTASPVKAQTTSTTAAPPATSSSSSDNNGFLAGTNSGDGTFYATGLGACGITNTDTDFICAVSEILFDSYPGYNGVNPNSNPVCGRKIKANYQGKSVTVTVTDRCTGCDETSLDFSPSAFDVLADPSVGRIHDMTWNWAS